LTATASGSAAPGTYAIAAGVNGDGFQHVMRIFGDHANSRSPVLSLWRAGAHDCFISAGPNALNFGVTNGLADYADATLSAAAQFGLSQSNANCNVDLNVTGHYLLNGSAGGLGGATRYIGPGGGSHFYYNVPTGGQHIFAVNETVVGQFTASGISTAFVASAGTGLFGGATGNRGAQVEIVHNSLYNAEASGLYLTTGTGTAGESGIYLFADKTNNIVGINSLQPGTGSRPLWISPGGGQVSIGGALGYWQTTALLACRTAGNAIEFGHNNSAGYVSMLGAEATSGTPFLGFNCELTGGNTYTTRGIPGAVFQSDLGGGFMFGQVPAATGSGQSLTTYARIQYVGPSANFYATAGKHLTFGANAQSGYWCVSGIAGSGGAGAIVGDFLPLGGDNLYSVGASGDRLKNLYVANQITLNGVLLLNEGAPANHLQITSGGNSAAEYVSVQTDNSGTPKTAILGVDGPTALAFCGSLTNHPLQFRTNNLGRWSIDTSGFFMPAADNTYDIGSASFRVRNGFFSGNVTINGALSVSGGTSINASVQSTTVGTPASSVETNLMTYTLLANSFSANNKAIRVTASGNTNNNSGGSQVVKFYFGGTSVGSIDTGNAVTAWYAEFVIVRTSSNNQRVSGRMSWGGSGSSTKDQYNFRGDVVNTDTANITVKFTGTGVGTVNDVQQHMMSVEALNL